MVQVHLRLRPDDAALLKRLALERDQTISGGYSSPEASLQQVRDDRCQLQSRHESRHRQATNAAAEDPTPAREADRSPRTIETTAGPAPSCSPRLAVSFASSSRPLKKVVPRGTRTRCGRASASVALRLRGE